MESKNRLDLDKKLEEVSGWTKARYIIGGLCFICTATFVLIHLGFVQDDYTPRYAPQKPFLKREQLWLLNAILGAVGGILIDHKRFLISGLAGLIATLAITGSSILYLSWRETVYMAEIVLPLLTGLVGIAVYNTLKRNR